MPERKEAVIKKCKFIIDLPDGTKGECGEEFSTKSYSRKFCNKHLIQHINKEKIIKCKNCGCDVKTDTISHRKYCDNCLSELRKKGKFLSFKRIATLPDGRQIELTIRQERILQLLGTGGLSEEMVAKMVSDEGKPCTVSYIKKLMDGKCEPPEFPLLLHQLLNKNTPKFISEVDRKVKKKILDVLDTPTKKDPLDWAELAYDRFAPRKVPAGSPLPTAPQMNKDELMEKVFDAIKEAKKVINEGN